MMALVLVPNHLPFVDLPQHLGNIAAIHGQHDPIWSTFFEVRWADSQYLFFYAFSHVVAYLVGDVETAAKIYIGLFLAITPAAGMFFFKAHQRPVIYGALAAIPIVSVQLFWGWINFVSSLPITLVGLGCLAHLARPESRPGQHRKLTIAFGAIALLCIYTHAIGYAWLALAALVQTLAMGPLVGRKNVLRTLLQGLLAAVPSVGALTFWIVKSGILSTGHTPRGVEKVAKGDGLIFEHVGEALHKWLHNTFAIYFDGSGDEIALAFVGTILLLILLRGFVPRVGEEKRSIAPEALFVVAIVLYFFAPHEYRGIWPLDYRFILIAFLLIPALGPTRLPNRAMFYGIALSLALICNQSYVVHRRHIRWLNTEMGQLDTVLAQAEPGKRLLGMPLDVGSRIAALGVFLHTHMYYQVQRGGLASYSFLELALAPVRFRPGVAPPPFVDKFEWDPLARFEYDRYVDYFDYYLVRTRPKREVPDTLFHSELYVAPRIKVASDRWKLYERVPKTLRAPSPYKTPAVALEQWKWEKWKETTVPKIAAPAAESSVP